MALVNHCSTIDEFYEVPGMINPPYVYGWITESTEYSAVFWCKKMADSERPYNLLFTVRDPPDFEHKLADSRRLAGCPPIIEYWNGPGGLSIETRENVELGNFAYVSNPRRRGPAVVVPTARVIVSEYDGAGAVFYCHQGEWFTLFLH
jgi:hypothetical protein